MQINVALRLDATMCYQSALLKTAELLESFYHSAGVKRNRKGAYI
jgi:hypothetical protein